MGNDGRVKSRREYFSGSKPVLPFVSRMEGLTRSHISGRIGARRCAPVPPNEKKLVRQVLNRHGAPILGMQIRSEFNFNSPNSLRIRSQREFAANSA